jgi:hypothetical protein
MRSNENSRKRGLIKQYTNEAEKFLNNSQYNEALKHLERLLLTRVHGI